MQYILDAIVLIILVVTIAVGYHRGFLRSFVQFVGCIAAFVLALSLSAPAASLTFNNFLAEGVETKLTEALSGVTEVPPADQLNELLKDLPAPIVAVLENSTQLESTLDELGKNVAATTEAVVETLMDNIIRPIAVSLLQFLIFIILFLVLMLIARLLAKLVKPITKLPLVRQTDGLLGAALGLVKGVIFVLALVSVLQLIAATSSADSFITQEMLDNSLLISWIAEINPLSGMLA